MVRFTFDKKNALLDLVEKAEFALGDFLVTSPTTSSIRFQYRHDYFHHEIVQNDGDAFTVNYSDVASTGSYHCERNWRVTLHYFSQWLGQISEDRAAMIKYHQRYATFEFEANDFLSERFIETLRQAEASENYGLTEMCGMAYRKAFEIMIKDYVMIDKEEDVRMRIGKSQIRDVIKAHVNDDDLKLLAHGVLELGNDHAHYIRRYTESNVDELKELIRKSVRWILRHEELKKLEMDRRNEIKQATEKFVK